MSENTIPAPQSPKSRYRNLAPQAPQALFGLITELGYPIETHQDGRHTVAFADLKVIGIELSDLVGKSPAWGARYLRDVLNAKTPASAHLTQAIFSWGAVLDGQSPLMSNTQDVVVRAQPGQLHPGAVVLPESKRCANPGCRLAFVPRVPNQIYCRRQCGVQARRIS